MKKTLLIIFTVFGLYACSDELTEELKQTNSAKASAEEIQYEILSFEEFFYRLTETKQADQKILQSIQNSYEIAKKRNQDSIEKDAVTDIVIDHFYDPIHTIETYSFVTQKFNEKGNFLEKFVVTINNEVLKTAYLRYYPEGGIFEELFTGKVELSTADQTITISDYFRNGERDNRTTNAVQKDCTTIFTFRSTRCTNGGRHKFGQMCGGKYTNDAYIYVTTDVVCKTTITSDIVQLSLELIDLNPAKGGGGGSSSNAKFQNFLYSLPGLTKNMLAQNSDLKTAVSVYLMQKNYSAASIKLATDLLNFIANDTVLRTNNNKLTQQIVQLSLFTNKFTVNSFITFWSSLTTEEKMILQNYANNGMSANGNLLKPSAISFLNWALAYLIQNNGVTMSQFENWFIDGGEMGSNEMTKFISDLDNPNIIIPTRRFKNNSRIYGIYNKAKNAANIKQYLQNFDPQFSVAHLVLDVQAFNNGSEANALTYEPEHYRIEIIFNSNKLNRPWLDIARTLMHEVIHAEMYRVLLSLAATNGAIDKYDLDNKLNSHNYPGLYEYYRIYGFDDMQHEQMADHYRNIIATFLKQLDNSLTNNQAQALAWVGLQGTTAWNNLTLSQQNAILNTYFSWRNSAPINLP